MIISLRHVIAFQDTLNNFTSSINDCLIISYIIEDWSFLKGIYLHALPCLSDLVVFIRIKCKYFSNCASPKGPTPSPINNSHYYIYVLHFQLIISNIEPNPGPLTNNFKTKNISIVHNNVCSLLNKIDVVYRVIRSWHYCHKWNPPWQFNTWQWYYVPWFSSTN